nr:hypothetical protein [Tanacetum cinerariifolium]
SYDWSYQVEEEPTNFSLLAFSSSSSNLSSDCEFRKSQFDVMSYQTGLESVEARLLLYKQKLASQTSDKAGWPPSNLYDRFLPSGGYHAVPPPMSGTFMPPKPDLVFHTPPSDENEHLAFNVQLSPTKPEQDLPSRPSAPIIEDWISDSKEDDMPQVTKDVPSFAQMQPSGEYHVVPLRITGNFMPPKPDLVFHTAPIAVETDHSAFIVKLSPFEPIQDLSHRNRPSAPIIEEWVSDSEDESETTASQIAPSFVQSIEQVKPPSHSVQPVETSIPAATPKPISSKSNRSGKIKNRKTYFVCKSVDHLIKDCDYHAKKKAQPTPKNYSHMGNHKQPVSDVVPKIMVTRPRHAHSLTIKSKSTIRRHITCSPSQKTSNSPPKVTADKAPVVSAAQDYELAARLKAEERR